MPAPSTVWFHGVKNRIYESRGGKCQVEGCTVTDIDSLEMAHVKPTKLKGAGRGSCRRALDWLKHPKCYVMICEGCHDGFDKGEPIVINGVTYQQDKE